MRWFWKRRTLLWGISPALLFVLPIVFGAAVALAQSTGGSFGGGSFGGGGSSAGSSGGSSSGSYDDSSDGMLSLVFWLIFSRLPWPLKLLAMALIGGVYAFTRIRRKRAQRLREEEANRNDPR